MTTKTPEEKRLAVRRRLRDDFKFYASTSLKIRTKDGEVVNLKLNEAQQRLIDMIEAQYAAEGKVRIIILKARQMGLSTAVGGWMYYWVSQRKAQKALVVTHHADSSKALFDMTRRFFDNSPPGLKPSTKYSSRRELKFDTLDSGYAVATAGGDSVARGDTVTVAHLSELAFWPKSSAKDILNGILQAVPTRKNTAIFVESTANGVSGEFADLWAGAVDGTNGFIPVFLPWYIQDEYREPTPEGFERTLDEQKLAEAHGLDDEQLMFRRRKIAHSGVDLFKQEYPSTAEEAFLTTGRPVFNSEQINDLLRIAPLPVEQRGLIADDYQIDPRGELLVYADVSPSETYYIGADVAMGVRGGDSSVAQVLDSHKRQVAVWRGLVHPDHFATVLERLGYRYNTAKIAVESNNHGILTCTRLGKDLAYPNFYQEVVYDKIDDKETVNLGFRTTSKSKPLVIDQLRASIRDGEMTLNDKTTLKELLTYIVTDTGSMEAESGCHDDCVVALALANHTHEGVFTPIVSSDDYYIASI
ncbi:hypothetical protein D3Y57_05510 [Sphingomonas paeninsulae]|uniref:Terminase large subunit gp17-like C-terminal domain-containing protein n=1 Tax=Sphingomonas paeninsulae TaxID=2319844 RepID=A0A494T893_SPHPE|nr:hypothetical protein [Sphingomonas paeninsulae]AYJ85537.1 hypothetical protein D3Y57_05510 [Sphingomonas paeninsulae]